MHEIARINNPRFVDFFNEIICSLPDLDDLVKDKTFREINELNLELESGKESI